MLFRSLAAKESEVLVEAAIGHLCDLNQTLSFEAVEALVLCGQQLAAPTAVRVDAVDLLAYDQLLEGDWSEPALGVELGGGVSHE